MLAIERTTLYRLRRKGALPTVQIGRKPRFRVSDLTALIDRAALAPVELA